MCWKGMHYSIFYVREFHKKRVHAICQDDDDWVTAVQCRRRPGHVHCVAPIIAGYAEDDPTTIVWECPACGDEGYISGWQETLWDKRQS